MGGRVLYSKQYVSKYSRFLIALAWTVEVIAVLIGLTISIVVAVSAYNSFASESDVGLLDGGSAIMVAGLPFVLIAVVEITKIPLTFAFMAVRNVLWRSLFLIFVLFLCAITFETLLNGFERNFSNLNRAIDSRKNEIESAEQEVALLENRRDYIVKFTEDDVLTEVNAGREEADAAYRQVAERIDENTRIVLADIDYTFEGELEGEIVRLETVRDEYYRDWREETAAVEDRFSTLLIGNISGSSNERDRLLGELDILKEEFAQAMLTANFFNRGGRERKYRELIRAKEDQLSRITTGYLGGDALEKQSTMEDQLKQQLEFVNAKYAGRVRDVNGRIEGLKLEIEDRLQNNANLESNVVSRAASDKARFSAIRSDRNEELDQYLEGKMVELEEIADQSFGIDEQIFLIRNKQRTFQSEINHLINQNQIYRLAMYFSGKESATDVERSTVGIVALIWFGSLSLIAAVCGVMLALAGFYLRRFADPGEPVTEPGKDAPVEDDFYIDAAKQSQDTQEEPLRRQAARAAPHP
tara:strand:+ start:2645 stop:4228 length:1584 start_codon:yes stop_codon:yes gene_type:complete